MIRLLYLLIFNLCVTLLSLPAYGTAAHPSSKLRFCVEDTEYPPFNYFVRLNGMKTTELGGYDIDLLARTFKPIGINYEVVALPWRRCLKDVLDGNIDGAMSASLDPQRMRDYIPSDAYYYLTPSYFYLKADFGPQFHVDDINQLAKFGTVCGINGFNYANFGWRKDTPISEISSLRILPQMLIKHRCHFFLARRQIIAGTLALNHDGPMPSSLTSNPSPTNLHEPFYMLISKRSPESALIKKEFNYRVKQLRDTKQLEVLYQAHLQKLVNQDDKRKK